MKRRNLLSLIALSASVFVTTMASVAVADPNYTCEYSDSALSVADLDGDGLLTEFDRDCMIEVVFAAGQGGRFEIPECTDFTHSQLDFNGSGDISIADLLRILHTMNFFGLCEEYGDLTGDGIINVADYQCMVLSARWAMSPTGPIPACLTSEEIADLDCDGGIDVIDVQLFADVYFGDIHPDLDADGNGIVDSCE